jgi:predicted secreted protein
MPPASLRVMALIGALLVAAPASAGEAAARRVIGFSADGGIFALEEYGAADPGMGKGDIHSFITFVDTATNQVLDESVSATLQGGGKELLGSLRRLSAQAAAPTIAFRKVAASGSLIGADPSSRAGELFYYDDVLPVERVAKASLAVEAPELGGKAELVLEYVSPPHPDADEPASDKSPPFVLTLVKPDGKRTPLTGQTLDPRAVDRGAFYKYALAEAWLLPRQGKPPVIGAVVETFTLGSEGVERNFVPVAGVAAGT